MSNLTPQWKLRRLASPGVRIVKRPAAEFPSIAVFEGTLLRRAGQGST